MGAAMRSDLKHLQSGKLYMNENPYSLRARLLAFFDANPEEELTRSDIATKFCVAMKTIDNVLAQARKDGELEPVHVWRRPAAHLRSCGSEEPV